MHDSYPKESVHFSEDGREIKLLPFEMIKIAETAQACLDQALEHDQFVISDSSAYLDIPHHNNLRTPDIRLALTDTTFSELDLIVPRKDTDLRIKIEGKDSVVPNRRIQLEETEGHLNGSLSGSFFVNDSHAFTSARNGRSTAPLMEKTEVAHWLYRQAGLTESEAEKKIKTEVDPVRNACDFLSIRAKQRVDIRQVRIQFNPDLEMYGQLVEEIDTDNPFNGPLARKYSVWVNQHHMIDGHSITERLLVHFSPDDILMGVDSPYSGASVIIESSHPSQEAQTLITQQALEYENGGVHDLFSLVYDHVMRMQRTA